MPTKDQSVFKSFLKSLWDKPINILLTVFSGASFLSLLITSVLDGWVEVTSALVFIGCFLVGNYLIFKEQQTKIIGLKRALSDIAPDIVPMPIEISKERRSSFALRVRNEGKSSARNISLKINYQDYLFTAKKGSLAQNEETLLQLKGDFVASPSSKARINRMQSDDQIVMLRCEFSTPSNIAYVTHWECEWGAEWTLKTRKSFAI